jgi:thiamine biosynthesis lipoprotein
VPDRITRCRPLLGTFVEITADDGASIDAGFGAIARVHRLMSAHEPDSDLSRVNRFAHLGEIEVDPWSALVLERALHWSKHSKGVFDVVAAGARAMASGHLPRHSDQPEPQASHWTWMEVRGRVVRLLQPACLDLGGIAKGFAIDRAVAALKSAGAASGLVNAGGDIAGFGPQPWPIQVVQPATRRAIANVAVSNGAVATSSVLPDGRDDHLHGRSASLISATVCAPIAMDADALTKIVLAQSPAAPRCLELADAQAFVLDRNGGIGPVEGRREAA